MEYGVPAGSNSKPKIFDSAVALFTERLFLRAGTASGPARLWLALTRSEDGRWIRSWKILEVIALYRLFDDKRYMSL